MAEYISATDVRNRLTDAGYEYVADRDMSGSGVSAEEEAKYITPAIQWAGAMIDGAIHLFVEPVYARGAGNQWLKDRCLDLAACKALEIGGRDVPERVRTTYLQSLVLLYGGDIDEGVSVEGVKQEQRIPGLAIPRPNTGQTVRFPRVRNLR